MFRLQSRISLCLLLSWLSYVNLELRGRQRAGQLKKGHHRWNVVSHVSCESRGSIVGEDTRREGGGALPKSVSGSFISKGVFISAVGVAGELLSAVSSLIVASYCSAGGLPARGRSTIVCSIFPAAVVFIYREPPPRLFGLYVKTSLYRWRRFSPFHRPFASSLCPCFAPLSERVAKGAKEGPEGAVVEDGREEGLGSHCRKCVSFTPLRLTLTIHLLLGILILKSGFLFLPVRKEG